MRTRFFLARIGHVPSWEINAACEKHTPSCRGLRRGVQLLRRIDLVALNMAGTNPFPPYCSQRRDHGFHTGRLPSALINRLELDPSAFMIQVFAYGPEGESYTLAQTKNQGVFSGVMFSVSAPAQHDDRTAEVTYRGGSKEVHHKIFNAHAGDIAYARAVENFQDACLDLPRLKIDTIESIDFVDMKAADQAKYPKNMDPNFIRKGNVTFRSGKKLDGVFLGVGMIRFDDEEMHGNLVTLNVVTVRFLPASPTPGAT